MCEWDRCLGGCRCLERPRNEWCGCTPCLHEQRDRIWDALKAQQTYADALVDELARCSRDLVTEQSKETRIEYLMRRFRTR